MPRALVVTADDELGAYVGELLRPQHRPEHAASALEALRAFAAADPQVVVVDADAGIEALAALRRRAGGVPILALAAAVHDVRALVEAGADDCVVKPFAEDELLARIDALVARGRAARDRVAVVAGLDHAFDAAPEPMALLDGVGRLVRVNRAMGCLLGLSREELLARRVADLTHPDDHVDHAARARELAEGRVGVDRGTWRLVRSDGSWLRTRISASVVQGADGDEGLVLWRLDPDVDAEAVPGAEPQIAARRAFDRAVRQQILRCERYGEQAALVRCSLPDLREVRRVHGAEIAERLMVRVLGAVRGRLRDTDVVAQVGDADLAALLAHADGDAAASAAAGLRDAVERERVVTPAGPVGTRAAVGFVPVAGAASPARALLEAELAVDDGPRAPQLVS